MKQNWNIGMVYIYYEYTSAMLSSFYTSNSMSRNVVVLKLGDVTLHDIVNGYQDTCNFIHFRK